MEIMQVRGLKKSFTKGPNTIPVLKGIDLDVHEGEFLSIIGQSGSGKSTLLHVMGLLTHPNAGEIFYRERRIDDQPNPVRDSLRNHDISMIFQFYHLLPELDIVENVLTPMMIAEGYWKFKLNQKAHRERAKALLERVGLAHRFRHKPNELSGGEMQRTAIARALINQPQLLLADEPTGNLDRSTEGGIIELLRGLNDSEKLTIVLVTHNPSIAAGADRTVTLTDGLLE